MINTSTHVVQVCRPGHGAETCRFLTMSHDGWACARGDDKLEAYIEEQMKLRADDGESHQLLWQKAVTAARTLHTAAQSR